MLARDIKESEVEELFQKAIMGESEIAPSATQSASEQAFIKYIFSQTGFDVTAANGYIQAFTVE